MQAQSQSPGEIAVNVMEQHTGTCPGLRRAHARGIFAVGEFQATTEAKTLSVAEHLQGDPIACLLRFSNASGNPKAGDLVAANLGRPLGLGVRFELPSGKASTWAAATIPAFPARNLEEFVGITSAQQPDGTPNIWRLLVHIVKHLHLLPSLGAIRKLKPLSSFAGASYNGVHTYYLVDGAGNRQPFRYNWRPRVKAELSSEEAKAKPPHFLLSELRNRLIEAPIHFDLIATFPNPTDPLLDATFAWPGEHHTVCLGSLRIDRVHADPKSVEGTVFDPTNVPPGIELSEDPLFELRASAYGASYARRSAESGAGEFASE